MLLSLVEPAKLFDTPPLPDFAASSSRLVLHYSWNTENGVRTLVTHCAVVLYAGTLRALYVLHTFPIG